MSRWGLTYKGVEVLAPDDWNSLVDALEELDKRCPLQIKGGTAKFNGDGETTTFQIPHGMTEEPTFVFIQEYSQDASGDKWIETDETNITVHFKTAPPAGTENIILKYIALKF